MEREAKHFFLLALLLVVVVASGRLLLLNLPILKEVDEYTAEGRWLEEKFSKGRLLLERATSPQVVFIGSSRTQNHIMTNIFEESGIDIFNYGIPSRLWEDYSYMVDLAIESGPESIVFMLPPDVLTKDPPCPREPAVSDMVANLVINGPLAKCIISTGPLASMLPINHYPKYLDLVSPEKYKRNRLYLSKYYGVKYEENKINSIRGGQNRLVVTFKSGDGIVYCRVKLDDKIKNEIMIGNARVKALNYLEYLTRKVKRAGIKPIVILEPMSYYVHYTFAKHALPVNPGYPIIDATNQIYGIEYWADIGHFNILGRERFSRWLVTEIKPLL